MALYLQVMKYHIIFEAVYNPFNVWTFFCFLNEPPVLRQVLMSRKSHKSDAPIVAGE